jgi:hypothetical protein
VCVPGARWLYHLEAFATFPCRIDLPEVSEAPRSAQFSDLTALCALDSWDNLPPFWGTADSPREPTQQLSLALASLHSRTACQAPDSAHTCALIRQSGLSFPSQKCYAAVPVHREDVYHAWVSVGWTVRLCIGVLMIRAMDTSG